jgi:hypothetical protein
MEKHVMRGFIIFFSKYYCDNQIKDYVMGLACSTHDKDDDLFQNSDWK